MSQSRIQHTANVIREQNVKFYPDQRGASNEILKHFIGSRYVLLAAQMQSGKTGCSLFVAFHMLMEKRVKKVFIISGTSETDLRTQWETKIPAHAVEFWKKVVRDSPSELCDECCDGEEEIATHFCDTCDEKFCSSCLQHHSKKKKTKSHVVESIEHQHTSLPSSDEFSKWDDLTTHVEVIWRQDLNKSASKFDQDYLIIWDESHFATTQKQTLHTFFVNIGIFRDIQGDTTCLEQKNSYMLSVSATRDSEQARFVGANSGVPVEKWKMVVMNTGPNYRGVVQMKEQGLINQAFPISHENVPSIKHILEKYIKSPKWFILRCTAEQEVIIKHIADELNIEVVCYNQKTKSHTSISILEKQPTKFSIFIVRGMLRMGKELPKQHVCAVYESTTNPQNNTMLQGLLGRVCGYYSSTSSPIDVFLPSSFIEHGLNEYCEVIKSHFTITITKTQHIPKRKISNFVVKFPNTPHRIPFDHKLYSPFHDSPTQIKTEKQTIFKELLNCIQDSRINMDRYSPEQCAEIVGFLNNSHKTKIDIRYSHKKDKKYIYDIQEAITNNSPILSGSKKSVVIWIITEPLPDTMFSEKDIIVFFTTDNKPPNWSGMGGAKCPKTKGKDIQTTTHQITQPIQTTASVGNMRFFGPETQRSPQVFFEACRQFVSESINPTHGISASRIIYGKHGGVIKFPGNIHELKTLFNRINVEFAIEIKYKLAKQTPTTIHIREINW